jgi:antitoxin HicB
MKIRYPAKITFVKSDKRYLVEFPDLKGCLTEGATQEEALKNAKEALTGYLASIFERGHAIPKPSKLSGRIIHLFEPEPEVATPIMLRKIRERSGRGSQEA